MEHTICLIASDDFEIVLPNPVLSVAEASLGVLQGPASDPIGFWSSGELEWSVLLCRGAFGVFSGNLLRDSNGTEIFRFELEGTTASEFEFARTASAIPGRALLADRERSGKFVLRFGGTSIGKSGRSIGCTGARGRGELGREEDAEETGARDHGFGETGREENAAEPFGTWGCRFGELGQEEDAECGIRPLLAESRPTDGERRTVEADVVAREIGRQVAVDGREIEWAATKLEFEFALVENWDLEVGVAGLELCDGSGLIHGGPEVDRVLTRVNERVCNG